MPRTTVRSSFGATRMLQLSHQTLNSTLVSTFATFIIPPSFVWLTWLFLKARDRGGGVIRLMFAVFQRAGQHKSSSGHRLAFSHSFTTVEGEQNGHVAFLATNAEIPPHVGLGPSRNIHKSLNSSLYWDNNIMPASIWVSFRNRLRVVSVFPAVRECESCCGS